MKKLGLVTIISLLVLLSSCVPQKDLIYLNDKNNKDTLNIISPILNKPYRVQSNDILIINIKTVNKELTSLFNANEQQGMMLQNDAGVYFQGYQVDDHGKIRIPVLGEVVVIGKTLEEIRNYIEKKLLEDYLKLEISLFVTVKLSGLRFTVSGEVLNPGNRVVFFDRVTVFDALANAGDILITGNRRNVRVFRQTPNGINSGTLDLTSKECMNSPYFYIHPNDFIYVEPLKQKSWGTGTTGVQSITTIISVLSLVTSIILLTQR